MMRFSTVAAVAGALGLGACAPALPQGPSVLALPAQGKSFAAFQQDDATCRYYGSQQTGFVNPSQAATQSGLGSAAIGTVAGAAAGALLGAAAGNPGIGAAAGAGGGLLLGSAVGSNNANATSATLQQRYDIAYTQCMYSKGNSVQAGGPLSVSAVPAYGYGPYFGGTTVALGFGGYYGGGWGRGWGGWRGPYYRRW
ncbi:MAG: glycine zipper family protein [Acetobacteraceae bacterium]|nr:glycine zipper family protein [Acetobacteraceae bacterium]